MTKRKPQKKTPKRKRVCTECNGEGDRIEECMHCMDYGCLECDGQGYIAYDCEYCSEARAKERAKNQKQAEKSATKKAKKMEMSKPGTTTFQQHGLTFTYLSETDLPAIIQMLAKESVCEHVFFGPNTEQETRSYFEPLVASIQSALAKNERPAEHVFTIRKEGIFLGQCALLPVAFSPGNFLIGLTIDDAHWRKGIGEQACRFLIYFAFKVLNARRLSGDCMQGNVGSRKVMEKCGFRYEGTQKKYWSKNGRVCDNHLFGLLKGQPTSKKVVKKTASKKAT